jgi:cytochrome P450
MTITDVDFALGGDIADLHGTLRSLRDTGPVARVRYYEEPAWLFTTFDAVEAAYRDDDLFPAAAAFKELTEPVLGRNLQCMHGAEHRRNRMLVSPAFRARVVPEAVRPTVREIANEIVDGFVSRGEADLVEDFNRVLPGVVVTRLLGVQRTADADFQRWAHELLSFTADAPRALAARDEFTRYLAPLVARRRTEPGDDLVSMLATAEVDGEQLDDEEIFSFIRLLFAAGTDTTFFGLGNALFALLTHPDQFQRVAADPGGELPWAVEEVLRWESPVSMEPRRAPTATTWFGQPIEEGARLLFGIAAANRDPARFDRPDAFDVARHPQPIMTFGIGPHFCLGAHLARAELAGALEVLIDRLPGLRLADPRGTRIAGTVLRGPATLAVRFNR